MEFLRRFLNPLFFSLRNSIAFSRPIPVLKQDSVSQAYFPHDLRVDQDYIERYQLQFFRRNFNENLIQENLYILKLLEDAFRNHQFDIDEPSLFILDIGCKNFSYATALYSFFRYYQKANEPREIHLDGIEVDAYRMMHDFRTRYDYAQHHIKHLLQTKFIIGDFLEFSPNLSYDIITWFLPFVFERPHLLWGLPKKLFKPEAMFEHAWELLKDNGLLLFVHQTEEECKKQQALLTKKSARIVVLFENYTNEFSPYQYSRYIIIVQKHL